MQTNVKNTQTNLSDIQSWMQSTLIEPRKKENTDLVNKFIAPSKQLNASQSLAIYQRSYYSRLIECLRGQFKALLYTLGDELFEEFCRMYLIKYPSSSASLSNLGDHFPSFLEENRPDENNSEPWIDFMISMAKFEVDLYRIFDIAGSEGAIFANIEMKDEELKLQKCIDLYEYSFDVDAYYQKVANEEQPEITKAINTCIAFLRINYQVYVIPLGKVQFVLLEAIRTEENIETALEKTAITTNLELSVILNKWKLWKKEWIEKGFFLKI
jgi:hypothetical protein